MTHSNHRRGSRESLDTDYVLTLRGGHILTEVEKAKEGVKILANNNPVGLVSSRHGDIKRYMKGWNKGMSLEALANDPDPPDYISAVYDNKDDVEQTVKDLAKAELGFSVVIAGVFDNVFDVGKKAGTGPHTVCMSMGTVGKTDRLPEGEILEITTMSGHSLVSQHLVRHLIERVRAGKMSAYDASLELGHNCMCNYLNAPRAAEIINRYIARTS